MLRSLFLAAAGSARIGRLAESAPVDKEPGRPGRGPGALREGLVRRFVAGDAVRVSRELVDDGLAVTLDHLGEDTRTVEQAAAIRDEYIALLRRLGDAGLTPAAEVSVKLSALGQRINDKIAYEHAHAICTAATAAGTTVTLDAEDHTTTDTTLETLVDLRRDFPSTGAVLQAYLRRTEGDCRELAVAGSRVRLCKGAYREPESVAYQSALDVDKSYVRCLNILMSGEGYPMVATHDPRLISIAEDRARWFDRSAGDHEFQLLHGVRPEERARLAAGGHTVRVYVPYGDRWFGYVMRRFAERPANVGLVARAVVSRK